MLETILVVLLLFLFVQFMGRFRRKAESLVGYTAVRSFKAQVHGITHRNSDGSSRQKIISDCYEGEVLQLIPEPDNRHDDYAIKVCRKNGEQLGYWQGGDSRMVEDLNNGKKFHVTIDEIYDFEEDEGKPKPRLGVRLRVDVMQKTV